MAYAWLTPDRHQKALQLGKQLRLCAAALVSSPEDVQTLQLLGVLHETMTAWTNWRAAVISTGSADNRSTGQISNTDALKSLQSAHSAAFQAAAALVDAPDGEVISLADAVTASWVTMLALDIAADPLSRHPVCGTHAIESMPEAPVYEIPDDTIDGEVIVNQCMDALVAWEASLMYGDGDNSAGDAPGVRDKQTALPLREQTDACRYHCVGLLHLHQLSLAAVQLYATQGSSADRAPHAVGLVMAPMVESVMCAHLARCLLGVLPSLHDKNLQVALNATALACIIRLGAVCVRKQADNDEKGEDVGGLGIDLQTRIAAEVGVLSAHNGGGFHDYVSYLLKEQFLSEPRTHIRSFRFAVDFMRDQTMQAANHECPLVARTILGNFDVPAWNRREGWSFFSIWKGPLADIPRRALQEEVANSFGTWIQTTIESIDSHDNPPTALEELADHAMELSHATCFEPQAVHDTMTMALALTGTDIEEDDTIIDLVFVCALLKAASTLMSYSLDDRGPALPEWRAAIMREAALICSESGGVLMALRLERQETAALREFPDGHRLGLVLLPLVISFEACLSEREFMSPPVSYAARDISLNRAWTHLIHFLVEDQATTTLRLCNSQLADAACIAARYPNTSAIEVVFDEGPNRYDTGRLQQHFPHLLSVTVGCDVKCRLLAADRLRTDEFTVTVCCCVVESRDHFVAKAAKHISQLRLECCCSDMHYGEDTCSLSTRLDYVSNVTEALLPLSLNVASDSNTALATSHELNQFFAGAPSVKSVVFSSFSVSSQSLKDVRLPQGMERLTLVTRCPPLDHHVRVLALDIGEFLKNDLKTCVLTVQNNAAKQGELGWLCMHWIMGAMQASLTRAKPLELILCLGAAGDKDTTEWAMTNVLGHLNNSFGVELHAIMKGLAEQLGGIEEWDDIKDDVMNLDLYVPMLAMQAATAEVKAAYEKPRRVEGEAMEVLKRLQIAPVVYRAAENGFMLYKNYGDVANDKPHLAVKFEF